MTFLQACFFCIHWEILCAVEAVLMRNDSQQGEFIAAQLAKLVSHLESMRVADYMELLEKPMRLIMINFIAGVARGLGIAIGATLVFAMMLEGLRRIILLNIPGIGSVVADLVRIVEMKNGGNF